MRIMTDSPLAILVHAVRQHLPTVWVPGEDMPWLGNPRASVQPVRCFVDREMSVPIDLTRPKARLLFTSPVAPVTIIAGFAMEMPAGGALFLRHDLVPLVAQQTDTSEEDGVVRLFGGEKGVVLFTPEHLMQVAIDRKKLIRGGINGSAYRLEVKNDSGDWNSVNVSIPFELIKELKL